MKLRFSLRMFTEENVGGVDLIIRAFVGGLLTLMLTLDFFTGWVKIVVAIIAFLGLYTSITRPLYCFLLQVLRPPSSSPEPKT